MPAVPNFSRKGMPYPYIITPESEGEARCGKATLLTDGHIEILLSALKGSRKWKDPELIAKLEALKES